MSRINKSKIKNLTKFYYLYKITNKLTGEYYYGVHETYNLNDGYFGSGSILKENINKYGLENFVKETIMFFPNRKELLAEEKRVVNKELLKDPKCLNVILGGGELKGSVGKKCVIDENGKAIMVDRDDDTYQSFFAGKICINKNGQIKYIRPYELPQYIDMGWKKGTIYNSPGKGKIWIHYGDSRLQIYEKDIQKYLDEGWTRGPIDKGILAWVNKGGNSKQINKEDLQNYLNDGWEKGFGKETVNGRIQIRNGRDRKFVSEEELQKYLNEGWERFTWDSIIWIHKENKSARIYKEDLQKYLNDGWKVGRYNEQNTKRRKVLIYDLNGNVIEEFKKVSDANHAGYNNIHKFAGTGKIYMKKYKVEYGS